MGLTRYGRREWLSITIIALLISAGCVAMGWYWALVGPGLIWLIVAGFFRDPIRSLPSGLPDSMMLSPADGTISAVLRVDHHEATDGPAVIVRIFLSVLNVHVNRSPCDGEVVSLKHSPGKYLNAQTEESAVVNESNLITLKLENDETIGVRQVAGMIARRIVCPLQIADKLTRGQKFGMIKFGSTTELILPRPDDVTVHVKPGEKVRGGLTMLASLDAIAVPSSDLQNQQGVAALG